MNVFALELGYPKQSRLCWDIIQARTAASSLAQANGKHFVQLAGVGLDAQVVKNQQAFKRSFGPLSYIVSATQIAAAARRDCLLNRPMLRPTEARLSRRQRAPLRRPFPFSRSGDR